MNIVFRVDASTAIGSGHVVRCLTLAEMLRAHGATVSFVCRIQDGHMSDLIEELGFAVSRLAVVDPATIAGGDLGSSWQTDAEQTQAAVRASAAVVDWLVVDHYGIDRRWEMILRTQVHRVMVIDDLADRSHDCDLFLDQNFDNPLHRRYAQLLSCTTRTLLGTQFALVRSQFAAQRPVALARRNGQLRRILLSMGGTDPANDTSTALAGLAALAASVVGVDVVIGASNPHRQELRRLCDANPITELHIQTSRMAELMVQADLAITAGGSTTWERCVMGLPAIVTIQSPDQAAIAEAVQRIGGHHVLGWSKDITAQAYSDAVRALTSDELIRMSKSSATLCDGRGAERVATYLLDWKH